MDRVMLPMHHERAQESDTESLDWAAFQTRQSRPSSATSETLLDEDAVAPLPSSVQEDADRTAQQDYYDQQVFKSKRDVLSTLLQETQSILVDLAERAPPAWPVREPAHAMDPPPYDDPRSPVLHVLQFSTKDDKEVWNNALRDLSTLQDRLLDPSSKVLVTGDINAGKSTLINALLHRNVLWTDQQPSTSTFTEILSTEHNDHLEEVHAVHPAPAQYNAKDTTSFTSFDITDLPRITGFPRLRAFVKEGESGRPHASLLANGVVDLHLIDSPGLNRHSTHTTAIFARQKLIDAVVFVVSAENHFTQSATDFLTTTCKEKPLVFIVVNKFDGIHDTKRCRREILTQLKAISPQTFGRSEELVHFVSAKEGGPAFHALQSQLRAFLLEKRRFSKLAPTKRLLTHMLQDITSVCHHNLKEATAEEEAVVALQEQVNPVLEKLAADEQKVVASLEFTEAQTIQQLEQCYKEAWTPFLVEFEKEVAALPWPGVFAARTYAEQIQAHFTAKWMATFEAVEKHRAQSVSSTILNLHALVTSYGASIASISPALDVKKEEASASSSSSAMVLSGSRFELERRDFVRFSGSKVLKTLFGGVLLTIGTGAYKYTKHVTYWVGEKITGKRNSDGSKWIVGTLGVCGASYVLYQTLTLRSSIQRRLLAKAEQQMRPMQQVEQMKTLLQPSRLLLRQHVYGAQNAYMRLLDEHRHKVAGWQQRQATATLATKWFHQRKVTALQALQQVHAVDVDL